MSIPVTVVARRLARLEVGSSDRPRAVSESGDGVLGATLPTLIARGGDSLEGGVVDFRTEFSPILDSRLRLLANFWVVFG